MNAIEKESLFEFIESQCNRFNIDKSHGIIHSKRCMSLVESMFTDNLTDDEKIVALYSAALHDLCDKKYVQLSESITTIRDWLWLNMLKEEMVEAILSIIQTMSYSYLDQRRYENGLQWYPDHGKWNKSYHLARNADLLEGYEVGRCYLYTKHIYPNWKEEQVWKRVEDFFDRRMFNYLSDGWLTEPYAIKLAPFLEDKARNSFKSRTWEYK
jgi:hypothetical protein